jgi:tetratricopeptide (TPR) repeat protein
MEELGSKFNINVRRDLFLLGEAVHVNHIKNLIKGYYFLNPREGRQLPSQHEDTHFVVAAIDFNVPSQMQAVARIFQEMTSATAVRLIFAVAPDELGREHLLFSQEIGARYVAHGLGKGDDLKEHLKRLCIENHQAGAMQPFEIDIDRAYKAHDMAAMRRVIDKLAALPVQSEEILRLQAITCMYVNEVKQAENHLKRLLLQNPQNLWAANSLGRLYLRSGRVQEGIEVLQRLSSFHDLNAERALELGDAYVRGNMPREAEKQFELGIKLTAGEDARFNEGLAKVKLADNDVTGAMKLLGNRDLSENVVSFLNMRAIMSIRSDKFEEGMQYYQVAVDGTPNDKELRAKLKFNMGLAYARTGDLGKAESLFFESLQLGGARFQRARGPLDTIKNIITNRGKTRPTKKDIELISDVEWETLY